MKRKKLSNKELKEELKRLADRKKELDERNKLLEQIEETKQEIKGRNIFQKFFDYFVGEKL